MNDVAFIYAPHYMTDCFRVSKIDQRGSTYNWVCVVCSPGYNGLWRYDTSILGDCDVWQNGKLDCYCVPISKCTFIKKLEDITDEEVIKHIKKMQNKWMSNEVKNTEKHYKKKPDWLLN